MKWKLIIRKFFLSNYFAVVGGSPNEDFFAQEARNHVQGNNFFHILGIHLVPSGL